MTDEVHILHCARCKRSFSYVPKETDLCRPDTPKLICTPCFEILQADIDQEAQYQYD